MADNDRQIVLFTSGAHGLVHVYELSIPILMTVWLLEYSVTAATLGLAVTVGYGLFGIGALPGGVLVDRFGSKPIIVACLVGMAISFLFAALAPDFGVLVIALALWGVAASVYHPAGLSLLSTSVSRPEVAFGYHGIGGNLGIALGPLATALLLTQFDWRVVAALLTVPTVLTVLYGLRLDIAENHIATTPDGGTGADTKGTLTVGAIRRDTRTLFTLAFSIVFLVVLFSGLFYRTFLTFLPDLLGDLLGPLLGGGPFESDNPAAGTFDAGHYLYVGILLVGVSGQYLGGRLAEQFRPERALIYVLAVLATLALLFVPAIAVGIVPFVSVALLTGVALFTIQPLQQATVADYSPAGVRGLSFGYTLLAIFGIGALGAGLAGAVLTFGTANTLFLLLAGIAAVGTALVFVLRYTVDTAD